jgi:predicted MFS family arabinose efflux permease
MARDSSRVRESPRTARNEARVAPRWLTVNGLLLGNFVIGLSVLAPAGMLNELARGLGVDIQAGGLLVTFGAIVLCVGSPLMAWATSGISRRRLLVGVLAVVTVGNAASAFAPGYASLLIVRLILLAAAAVFTPQAAGTIALIVSERERASSIAYIFVGWSVAVALGLPAVTLLAGTFGWREAYVALAVVGAVVTVMVSFGLPSGLRGMPLSFASWGRVVRSAYIDLLLANTALRTAAQFVVTTYLAPLLLAMGAGSQTVGLFFALFGIFGIVGNVAASMLLESVGAYELSMVLAVLMVVGALLWTVGAGNLLIMAAGVVLVGLGFAAANSVQQGRLVLAAPPLASASVALNTSAIYVGQAAGSALGGWLFARGSLRLIDLAWLALFVLAAAIQYPTRVERPLLQKTSA